MSVMSIKEINTRIEEIKESGEFKSTDFEIVDHLNQNILHYAVYSHDLGLIKDIIKKARYSRCLTNIINHRNICGTNSLGFAFLEQRRNNPNQIRIATIFASTPEYNINDYLNNHKYMDYSSEHKIGGRNLLHNVILTAQTCTKADEHEVKKVLSIFFETLVTRIRNSTSYGSYFIPNYPSMHPDAHLVSTSKLLKNEFQSEVIRKLCEKLFAKLVRKYNRRYSYSDSSGDSDDEASSSYDYKKMLLEYNEFIKESLQADLLPNSENENFQRTFDRYIKDFAKVPDQLSNDNKFDEFLRKRDDLLKKNELTEEEYDKFKEIINSIYVPLFHGVPFMNSHYTNYQRRVIADRIFDINKKLLKNDGLNEDEKEIIGIHTRTATATVGIQSLYELVTASKVDLRKLKDVDIKLLKYFKRKKLPTKFKGAMKKYVFNFSKNDSIKTFWEENNDEILPDQESNIIKHRFPIVATSKAPDHAIRFAIGRNVEGSKGEEPMLPQYKNGRPTHRFAGLVYITLHKLTDLIGQLNDYTMIDVNQSLKNDNISQGQGQIRFMHQHECDFMGKISSHTIAGVIPIVYPHIREKNFQENYHKDIYGINISATDRKNITSPLKIKKDLKDNPNPNIVDNNLTGFGQFLMPTCINLINGMVTAIATHKQFLLCTINDNDELIRYNVRFDQKGGQYSEVQNTLNRKNNDRLWKHIASRSITDESHTENESIGNVPVAAPQNEFITIRKSDLSRLLQRIQQRSHASNSGEKRNL